jgi:hypothetical protein
MCFLQKTTYYKVDIMPLTKRTDSGKKPNLIIFFEITIFPIPSRNSPPGPICLELLYCVLGLANWRPHVPPSPSSSGLLIIRYKISDIS